MNRQEAIATGVTTYTGSRCQHCDGVERYTRGAACVPCSKARSAARKAERLAQMRERYATDEEHRDRIRTRNLDWYYRQREEKESNHVEV